MRISLLVVAVLIQTTALTAHAGPRDRAPGVAYIPAPAAKSPGRAAVITRLRALGKSKFVEGREADAESDYTFSVSVLLDTPALFSLAATTSWMPPGRGEQGARRPILFEMKDGHEYDIGQLYRVRKPGGGLIAPVLALVLRHTDPEQMGTAQEVFDAVTDAFSHGRPQLFVTKMGIEVWPENGQTWLDSGVITWAELRPYLDLAEARRIGWTAP